MEVYSIDQLCVPRYNNHSKHILINFPWTELIFQLPLVKDFRLRLAQHVPEGNISFFF